MQTFLPELSYEASAARLDPKRLGKQRVEAMQILSALTGWRIDKESGMPVAFTPKGWVNHPATKMWRGYEAALAIYQNAICDEWTARGRSDSTKLKTQRILRSWDRESKSERPWWYTEEFSSAHRSALLFKDPHYYGQHNWPEEPKYEYIWPV